MRAVGVAFPGRAWLRSSACFPGSVGVPSTHRPWVLPRWAWLQLGGRGFVWWAWLPHPGMQASARWAWLRFWWAWFHPQACFPGSVGVASFWWAWLSHPGKRALARWAWLKLGGRGFVMVGVARSTGLFPGLGGRGFTSVGVASLRQAPLPHRGPLLPLGGRFLLEEAWLPSVGVASLRGRGFASAVAPSVRRGGKTTLLPSVGVASSREGRGSPRWAWLPEGKRRGSHRWAWLPSVGVASLRQSRLPYGGGGKRRYFPRWAWLPRRRGVARLGGRGFSPAAAVGVAPPVAGRGRGHPEAPPPNSSRCRAAPP